jgi:hypothetical protein
VIWLPTSDKGQFESIPDVDPHPQYMDFQTQVFKLLINKTV